ncbi:MAG: glycosyltransferase [Sulfuricellaceae bacterium]|jgi:glycosyltransferase involved in cell wall biosynthesis
MKLALITTNLRGGGAEKALVKLAALMAGRGHEVHLVLLENIVEHAPPEGVAVHALTPPGKTRRKGFLGKRLATFALKRLAKRLAKSVPFDLVVSTLPFADEIVSLAHLPNTWFRIANTLSAEIGALRRRSPAKAERRLARYRSLYEKRNLIAVSGGVAEDLRLRLGLKHSRIATIPNPFDAEDIRRQADEAAPSLPNEPYVVHVGRFAPQKRHDLLFDAWRRAGLPHRLVLLTPPDPRLDALIAQYGLEDRVTVAGFQRNPYPWMRKADALVLCSDHEGLPNVLIEALICGTPIVSTDCPSGPKEIMVGELARFLVPMSDAAALAIALRNVVEQPPVLSDELFAPFSAETVAREYEALAERY